VELSERASGAESEPSFESGKLVGIPLIPKEAIERIAWYSNRTEYDLEDLWKDLRRTSKLASCEALVSVVALIKCNVASPE
jgi:hypothetical protein